MPTKHKIHKNCCANSKLEMKLKNNQILDKIGQVVNLGLMLEEDMNTLHRISEKDILPDEKSVHQIRKSLKSISAILFLFEFQIDQTHYLRWKSDIKSLSKQYALRREYFINLQMFNKVEDKIKGIDKSDLLELRTHFESKYHLIVQENIAREETIRQGNETVLSTMEAIKNCNLNSELKLLNRRHLKSYQKSQKIFKKLSLNSSSEDFHEFRKSCKRFYLQQLVFNKLGFEKTSKKNKKFYQLTEYLGKEHDLNLSYHYLGVYSTELAKLSRSFFMRKIKKLRENVLRRYPEINY